MSETLSPSARTAEVQKATLGWVSELLEDPAVGAEDNFLDLGGHSMLALQLNQQAKERFGAEYDIQTLFEGTLAEAATELAGRLN
ncbi:MULTISPECIES: phosphopantetheine-binding protein [unclassified Streptomyces]|uniref:phosphopantetheine-binding protein n=1 Tax=unclassified Streptomyces TaxID=2593676 RepID=UPI0033B030F5